MLANSVEDRFTLTRAATSRLRRRTSRTDDGGLKVDLVNDNYSSSPLFAAG